jgi:hypothetical protein
VGNTLEPVGNDRKKLRFLQVPAGSAGRYHRPGESYIDKKFKCVEKRELICMAENFKMVLAGSTDDDSKPDLFREAFSLMNDPTTNIEDILENSSSKYLYNSLKSNAKILRPLTFLMDDEDQEKGEQKNTVIFFLSN